MNSVLFFTFTHTHKHTQTPTTDVYIGVCQVNQEPTAMEVDGNGVNHEQNLHICH